MTISVLFFKSRDNLCNLLFAASSVAIAAAAAIAIAFLCTTSEKLSTGEQLSQTLAMYRKPKKKSKANKLTRKKRAGSTKYQYLRKNGRLSASALSAAAILAARRKSATRAPSV